MKNLKILMSIGYLLFLVIDIFHFIFVRFNWEELEGIYFHLPIESFGVSISKWIFCITSLLLINGVIKMKGNLQDLLMCLICGLVISIEIIFGPFRGSIVGSINLLPILSLLAVVYFYFKIDLDIKVRLLHYGLAVIVYFLLLFIPSQFWEYFYL